MRFLTAGESHGEALTGIIEGFPSGIRIDVDYINTELARRQMGFGRGQRMSIEKDEIKILSGMRKSITTGSPISFIINNLDWKNQKDRLENEADILNPRPGHADLPGILKYRHESIRCVLERSSARETAMRVVIGSFSKQFLKYLNIEVNSFVTRIGRAALKEEESEKNLDDDYFDRAEESDLRCPDESTAQDMKNEIDKAHESGDTLGGSFIIRIKNIPCGIGSYIQWNKRLDALLSYYLMSIPSVKAIEIGNGIKASASWGTSVHDEIFYNENKKFYRVTNNAGGIEGGMSNGEDIILKIFLKPIPTTLRGLETVNIRDKSRQTSIKERSDICAVPSASVIGEAMSAIAVMNAVQDKFGRDNILEIVENYKNYMKYIKNF